jgi:hypothetical protein
MKLCVLALALGALLAASGCGGGGYKQPQIEVSGDELTLPDGTLIKVEVSGELRRACNPGLPAGAEARPDCLPVTTCR